MAGNNIYNSRVIESKKTKHIALSIILPDNMFFN